MNRLQRIGVICFGLSMLLYGATWGTQVNHARNPVPIAQLGLTEEAAEKTRQFVAALPAVGIVGADSDADNRSKRAVLTGALYKANGNKWPWSGPQEIGDCPSMSTGRAVECDIGMQISNGAPIEFHPVCRMWMYYGSRIRDGRVQISGDGGIPSWGCEFGQQKGILWGDLPGVPPYKGATAKEWGRSGPPQEFYPLAEPYKIGMVAPVRSAQEACNFLASGYPIAFGSMRWGTTKINLVEGRNVAVHNAKWPHAQCCVGYDGTTKKYGNLGLFRIDNSWGPDAHDPKSTFDDDAPGGYYVTWDDFDAICKEGMAVAVSGTNGFQKRHLDMFDIFNKAPAGPSAFNSTGEGSWDSASTRQWAMAERRRYSSSRSPVSSLAV